MVASDHENIETGLARLVRIARGFAAQVRLPWIALAGTAALALLVLTSFEGGRLIGWLTGPSGRIFVSSPGVYTRERLVNDRNDQDYWLRKQLDVIDAIETGPSAISDERTRLAIDFAPGNAGASADGAQKSAAPAPAVTPARISPALSFVDAYRVRAAARDTIRQSVLENLLDDRHDLTGNSVYGLKFDTTVYPGSYTEGRAYVRLSIKADQSDLAESSSSPSAEPASLLPRHLETYFQSDFADIKSNPDNPNHNSFKLYSQWLANVGWRLNSHLGLIVEKACFCPEGDCGLEAKNWQAEIATSINTIFALDSPVVVEEGSALFSEMAVPLPEPWQRFLNILVRNSDATGCAKRPEFIVDDVVDQIFLFPTAGKVNSLGQITKDGVTYQRVDIVDAADTAFTYSLPDRREFVTTRYRNIGEIARYAKRIGLKTIDKADGKRFVTIPSGYFNFIEKVIKPDFYAYSLFPRMEAASVLRAQSSDIGTDAALMGDIGASANVSRRQEAAALEPIAVGFTDPQTTERTKAIDIGWVIGIKPGAAPFQRSQFALIAVPAWTSQLKVSVTTGWLDSSSRERPHQTYEYWVPIPPDYEAFDAFIGGEEAIRRPQISDDLIDERIELVACRKASILIPGLRLWRSAMVTVGSERADRITVLPNMRGIIAEFGRLPLPVKAGMQTLRVWTSEGVDSKQDIVSVSFPENLSECGSDEARPVGKTPDPPARPGPVADASGRQAGR